MNIRETNRLRETYRNWLDSPYAGRYQKTAAVDGKHRRGRQGFCGKSERSDGIQSDWAQSCRERRFICTKRAPDFISKYFR